MYKLKNISFACIALLVLGSYFLVPYIIFKFKQTAIRKEIKKTIKAGIPKNEMIRFSQEELNAAEWEKPGKEFWLNGNLYDIVKTEKHNEIIYYWCINDDQEKELFATLDNLVGKRMNKENEQLVKKNAAFEWFCNDLQIILKRNLQDDNIIKNLYLLKHYCADIYLIPPPPPECA
jgi:hypothetical protein